jgi:hypothetical protein
LGEAGSALGVVGGLSDIARAVSATSGTDSQRAANAARGAVGATRALAGSRAVASAFPAFSSAVSDAAPYAAGGLAAWDIANIADSKLPDDRKAFEAAKTAAQAAVSYLVPVPGVGFGVGTLFDAAASKIFEDPYAQTRKEDAGKVRPAMTALLGSIDTATTLDELNAAASINAAMTSGEVGGRGVALRGVHLDTSGSETALSDAYNARKALIEAATANPHGPEAQQLAQVKTRFGPMRSAADVVSRSLAGGFQTGDPSSAQILAAAVVPPEMQIDVINNDLGALVLDRLDEWKGNLERFNQQDQGRTSADAPHVASQRQAIADLTRAAQVLKLDLGAAQQRREKTRTEQAYIQYQNAGGGGE